MRRFRARRVQQTEDQRIVQQALSSMVARHPGEYLDIARAEIALIPNGGSILPWRYRRQFIEALDRAERQLVLRHLDEWTETIADLCVSEQFQNLTPEDFLR